MRRRSVLRLLLALVTAFGSCVAMAAAEATPDYVAQGDVLWKLTTRPITITRGDNHYFLRLTVTDRFTRGDPDGDGPVHDQVTSVRLWSRSHPAGPAKSVQTHDYGWDFLGTFNHSTTLRHARPTSS